MQNYDFCGWATRNNIKCSDGRVIMRDAFKSNDGETVPLVWNHRHDESFNVLGHALLENRDDGVYAYCKFNDTESGKNAKLLVENGDISHMSIYANKLQHNGNNVIHGAIREVSLVLSGANPGAVIQDVIKHGEEADDEAFIFMSDEYGIMHSDSNDKNETKEDKEMPDTEKTVADVFNELTEEQKNVVYAIIGEALDDNEPNNDKTNEEDENMKHNVFDNDIPEDTLSHSEMESIMSDAKRYGSLKDSVLAHGIDQIDWLFPEAQNLNNPPEFIKRDTGWVSKVMSGVHHTPFSRIKSQFANITEDDARAKGYIKGNRKKEEVFGLLKRTTTPTTIYKKQKLDRDDVIDITDFDVVSWLKAEMRMMLDEELARAYLIGDNRPNSSDDKINEQCIRPIVSDDDLFTIKKNVTVSSTATDTEKAKTFIKTAIKARKDYKGSGEPTLYCTEDVLTDMLLIEDLNGRVIYESQEKLKSQLRVKDIVTVPVMEGVTGPNGGTLMGIIVNLSDYNVGADKGGAVNMFDDFDIDYNAQKYLIETRCSGALIKPYSAIALELEEVSG